MARMRPEWLRLAGELLGMASEKFSNHGCNDFKWPDGWTPKMRRELVVAMSEANLRKPLAKFTADELEDVERTVKGDYGPGDWSLMWFFADRLAEAK